MLHVLWYSEVHSRVHIAFNISRYDQPALDGMYRDKQKKDEYIVSYFLKILAHYDAVYL